jgi:hypothetical protein
VFREISLLEGLEKVASPEEWAEFAALQPASETDLMVVSIGCRDGSPYERRVLRYRALYETFASRVREKLLTRDWEADGFSPSQGPRAQPIHASLWRVLEINLDGEVIGGGFHFTSVIFSEKRPPILQEHRTKRKLRSAVRDWIEEFAEGASRPHIIEEVREHARRAFYPEQISDTLFEQSWSDAEKPPGFVQRGRPKKTVGF